MKNITLYLLLLVLPFCFGCSTLFSGVDFPAFPVKSKEFDYLIGKRYKITRPLVIGKFEQSWGGDVLVSPDFNVKKNVDVPIGSIIVIDHISKSYRFGSGESYWYIARFENSAIYKGKFIVDYLMIFEKGDFVGMDSNYLVEI